MTRLRTEDSPEMPSRRRNITHVVRSGLCHLCGTCYAVCPRENIALTWSRREGFRLHVKDASRCRGCGLCARVCPGAKVDLPALNRAVFGRVPDDLLLGHVRAVYLTRAADPRVHLEGASGGTVGALMRYLLDRRLVKGVRASRMGAPGDPLKPHAFVARSVADLADAGGSVYQMAPGNAALRGEVRSGAGLACVGLGCQVRGLRKAASVLKPYREGIDLVIGLFCGHNAEPAGTEHLLQRLRTLPSRVRRVRYRAGPHPGAFQVLTSRGRTREIPFRRFTYILTLFEHYRCGLCTDPLNTLADLSIGDGWMPRLTREGGWNVTIVRSERGEDLFRRAAAEGVIEVREATPESVRETQALVLYRRNRGGEARARLLRFLGKRLPSEPGLVRERPRPKDYLRALEMLVPQWMFGFRFGRRFFAPLIRVLLWLDERTIARKDRSAGRAKEWLGQFEDGAPGRDGASSADRTTR